MYSHVQEGAVAADQAESSALLGDDPAMAPVSRATAYAALRTEIARAMQVAAVQERRRIDVSVGDEETAQVEKIYARAAAEAAELSKHADDEVDLVNAWYDDEVRRIRAEADRQVADRRQGLEQSLTQHGSLIEAEIESVHVAVEHYRASLDTFFGQLAEERDPSAIARLAGDLPDAPDLDEVRAEARAAAMQALDQGVATDAVEEPDDDDTSGGPTPPERELVAVMDPDAAPEPVAELVSAAVAATTPVTVAVQTDQPAPSAPPATADGTAPAADGAVAAQGNVAVRVFRALTLWASPAGTTEDQ